MNDIFERISKEYHYRFKYMIALCIALGSIVFLGMIIIAVLFTDAAGIKGKEGVSTFILILIPMSYLRWFLKNWRTSNRSICQYYDIRPEYIKKMIEKEVFHDCSKEKIPSKLYQESSNCYMICGRFIIKNSVLGVNYIRTGSSGGRGASSNVYEFILINGKTVSLTTPFYIQLLGKVSLNFDDDTEGRRNWSTFRRARKNWIKSFYKQWILSGNQPISLLTDGDVVNDYKNKLIIYINQKEHNKYGN